MVSDLINCHLEDLKLLMELLTSIGKDPFYLKEAIEEWEKQKKANYRVARKIHVGAIFAFRDLFTAAMESPNITSLLLTHNFPQGIIRRLYQEVRNLGSDYDFSSRIFVSSRISSILLDLFEALGTSLVRYKELSLGIKEVSRPEVTPSGRIVYIKVDELPEEIRASLGIKGSPLISKELIKLINNTVIIVSKATPGRKLEWVKVKTSHMSEVSSSDMRFFTIDGIPHVFLVVIPNPRFLPNLFRNHWTWSYGCFYSSVIVDLFFYFRAEEWVKFAREVIMSAAGGEECTI